MTKAHDIEAIYHPPVEHEPVDYDIDGYDGVTRHIHRDAYTEPEYWTASVDGYKDRFAHSRASAAEAVKIATRHAATADAEDERWERYGAAAVRCCEVVSVSRDQEPYDDPQVGGRAVIHSHGRYRVGIVTKVTAKRVSVYLTTPGAIAEAQKFGQSRPNMTHKTVSISEVFA